MTVNDIVSLGWNHIGSSTNQWFSKKGEFRRSTWTGYEVLIDYNLLDNWMRIVVDDFGSEEVVFNGVINTVEEFQTILKLTQIDK